MSNWEFLPNPGQEEEGLGHAGIETFKGSRYPSLARECSQNSLDAAAKLADGTGAQVHLVFRLLLLQESEIPGLATLRETFKSCLKQARSLKRSKDEAYFARAINVSSQAPISVLSVEDYGTTGLIGPAESGKPFYALVKSSGVSQKSSDDAGGSFGIGKNAVFAVSDLRTVFYSTLYKASNGEHQRLSQGKSILVSHINASGHARRATGYWGKADFSPLDDDTGVPKWLRRQEIGTTVASIGFIAESDRNWHWQMVESLVRNFFAAVKVGAIHFTVQRPNEEPIEINAGTLLELFQIQEVESAAEMAGTSDDLKFSADMLGAMTSDAKAHEKTFQDVGTFRLRIMQAKGLPRKVGILRNGMYIADNLRQFGHPLARFPLSKDFVAVLEPADRQTSGILRDMESPKHDEFSADRIDDPTRRNKLRSGMKKVGAWIREIIKSETEIAADSEVLLDELNRFFPSVSDQQAIPDSSLVNDDPETTKLLPKKIKIRPIGSGDQGDSGSSGGQKKSKGSGGRTSGNAKGKGRGSQGGRGGKNFGYYALRNSIPSDGHGVTRLITFTPDSSGMALLELSAVGIHADEVLVIQAIDGKPCAKTPKIELNENERLSMSVRFMNPYTGPINMVLSRIEGQNDAN